MQKKGDLRIEVRRESVAGRGPGSEVGMEGMQLMEGEMAERLIEEAGAVEALEMGVRCPAKVVGSVGSEPRGQETGTQAEQVSTIPDWTTTREQWRDWYEGEDVSDFDKYEAWMDNMNAIYEEESPVHTAGPSETAEWAAQRWGAVRTEWPLVVLVNVMQGEAEYAAEEILEAAGKL